METSKYNIEYWESASLDVLRKATVEHGIKASNSELTNYGLVFSRDGVMAGIAGLLYDDKVVINGFKSTMEHLFKFRGAQGQIASNYGVADKELKKISFGTLSPKIDSATWYLIGVSFLNKSGYPYHKEYVDKTINLLNGIEYNDKNLLYVPQGGNWADEYPYEGYILYDQVLRLWSTKMLGSQYAMDEWTQKSESIYLKIVDTYFNTEKNYYNCSYTPGGVNDTFDFAAHCLLGLAVNQESNEEYQQSLDWIEREFIDKEILPGAFYPIIQRGDDKWKSISNFHLFDFKNKPYHYHNGGIWLIWIGWYALVLSKYKRTNVLKKLASLVFNLLNSSPDFDFDEYFSSDTLRPYGTKQLCYSASGILFICAALTTRKKLSDLTLVE